MIKLQNILLFYKLYIELQVNLHIVIGNVKPYIS